MTNSVINKLESIQQSLYEQAFSRAKAIMFGTSRSLKDYYRRFENDLPSGGEVVTLDNICHEIHEKTFILCGDFHTLKQSQRGFLRLIKAYLNNYKNKEIIIALEAFRAVNQNYLDQYLSGELTEVKFLELIEYNKYWDFPWPNFKMLLDFAKNQKVKICGINSDRGGRDNIFSRDRFVANQLNSLHKEHPEHKIFCLIGELHLSQQHLPSYLLRRSKASPYNRGIIRILCNVDKYYHGLSSKNFTKSSEYLQIKKNLFCILNSPPWMKWQSFNMWQEMHFLRKKSAKNVADIDEEESDYLAEYFDIDSHFLNIASLLAGFFELDLKTIDLYNFNIFTGDSVELEEYL
ncbi:MAG: ChaN family lipoprotein, partial [Oligoflexales bacterium]|nr:ChaN family lipoprotein [Oligoflexales bacterium]